MNDAQAQHYQSPEASDFKRELDFYPFQILGIPILFLVPLLALFGVLGETKATLHANGASVSVVVNYSNRINFQSQDETEIAISNTNNEPIPKLTVSIEKAYLDNFSEISFLVDIREISAEAYIIELLDLQAAESRLIRFSSRGAAIGLHRGRITVSTEEDEATITLETFVYP